MSKQERTAYLAAVELYRTFLFEDGPVLETMAEAGGTMDHVTLSRIAQLYSVARTIPTPSDIGGPDVNREQFAKAMAALACQWPADFQSRAKACRDVAVQLENGFDRRLRQDDFARKSSGPHSAVTKFIWFLKPEGWTVYDRLAADAVLRSGGNTQERQARFYLTIDKPLSHWAGKLRPILEKFDKRLHAERLLDKFLLMQGAMLQREVMRQQNGHFLRVLPDDLAARVRQMASDVAEILPDDAFPLEEKRSKSLAELKARNLFIQEAAA